MRLALRSLVVSLALVSGVGCGDDGEPEVDVADQTDQTTGGGSGGFCDDFAFTGAVAVSVIERYGWDPTRASVEGTPEERAALSALDADSDAQRAVTQYVRDHC